MPSSEQLNPPRSYYCYECGANFSSEDLRADEINQWSIPGSRRRYTPVDDVVVYHHASPLPMQVRHLVNYCTRCIVYCSTCERTMVINSLNFNRGYRPRGCSSCFGRCASCREEVAADLLTTVQVQYDETWRVCGQCASICDRGHLYASSEHCVVCDELNTPHRIRSYSYKPVPQFFGAKDNPYPAFFVGIEQELESKRGYSSDLESAQAIIDEYDTDGLLYVKEDGSLECGMEIVSHPMSIPYFNEQYPWDIWKPRIGAGKYLKSARTTGVHAHVSKAAFDKAHMYRFLAFQYLHPSFIETIAGRESNHYTEARPFALNLGLHQPAQKLVATRMSGIAKKRADVDSRYWAINTQNADTVELRYFRSTTDGNRLRFYSEWLEALYLYTQSGWIRTRRPERMLTPHNMRKWCEAQPSGKFERLTRMLVQEGV